MPELTQARLRAAVIIIAPVVGLIGATVHPYIGDLEDNAETARVIADDTTRWAWAHVIEMGGNALFVLAVIARSRPARWCHSAPSLSIVSRQPAAAPPCLR